MTAAALALPAVGTEALDFTLPSTSGAAVTLSANVEVLPIGVDSIPTLKEFRSKEHLPFDLLSDFRREASRLYGTLLEDKFFSQRAYVLIDRDGIVRWIHVEEHAGLRRENSELLAEIAKLA